MLITKSSRNFLLWCGRAASVMRNENGEDRPRVFLSRILDARGERARHTRMLTSLLSIRFGADKDKILYSALCFEVDDQIGPQIHISLYVQRTRRHC
jgi:hypothetical protein